MQLGLVDARGAVDDEQYGKAVGQLEPVRLGEREGESVATIIRSASAAAAATSEREWSDRRLTSQKNGNSTSSQRVLRAWKSRDQSDMRGAFLVTYCLR